MKKPALGVVLAAIVAPGFAGHAAAVPEMDVGARALALAFLAETSAVFSGKLFRPDPRRQIWRGSAEGSRDRRAGVVAPRGTLHFTDLRTALLHGIIQLFNLGEFR